MFERYTEKARRAIFFARYEASQFGSPFIESEHLLLGLLRENKHFDQWIPEANPATIREWIDDATLRREKGSTSIDLPLSFECRNILKSAADEAEALKHRHIETEHLFSQSFPLPNAWLPGCCSKLAPNQAAFAHRWPQLLTKNPQEFRDPLMHAESWQLPEGR